MQEASKETPRTLDNEKKEINNELKNFFKSTLKSSWSKKKESIKEIIQRIDKTWEDKEIQKIIQKIASDEEDTLFEIIDDYYCNGEEKDEEEKKIKLHKWLESVKEISNYHEQASTLLEEYNRQSEQLCKELKVQDINYFVNIEDGDKEKEKVEVLERKIDELINIFEKKIKITEELIKKNDKGEIDIIKLSKKDEEKKDENGRDQFLSILKSNIKNLINFHLNKIVCLKVKNKIKERIQKKLIEEIKNFNFTKLTAISEKKNLLHNIIIDNCDNSNLDALIKIKENLIAIIKKYHYEEAVELFKKKTIKESIFESDIVLNHKIIGTEWEKENRGTESQTDKLITILEDKSKQKRRSIYQSWPLINDLLFFQAKSLNCISIKETIGGQRKNSLGDFLSKKEDDEQKATFNEKFEKIRTLLSSVPWLSSKSMEKTQETKIEELKIEELREDEQTIKEWIYKIEKLLSVKENFSDSRKKITKNNLLTLLETLKKIKKVKEEIIEILELNIVNIIPKDYQWVGTKSVSRDSGAFNDKVVKEGKKEQKKVIKEGKKEKKGNNKIYWLLFGITIISSGIIIGMSFWWYTMKIKKKSNINDNEKK